MQFFKFLKKIYVFFHSILLNKLLSNNYFIITSLNLISVKGFSIISSIFELLANTNSSYLTNPEFPIIFVLKYFSVFIKFLIILDAQ